MTMGRKRSSCIATSSNMPTKNEPPAASNAPRSILAPSARDPRAELAEAPAPIVSTSGISPPQGAPSFPEPSSRNGLLHRKEGPARPYRNRPSRCPEVNRDNPMDFLAPGGSGQSFSNHGSVLLESSGRSADGVLPLSVAAHRNAAIRNALLIKTLLTDIFSTTGVWITTSWSPLHGRSLSAAEPCLNVSIAPGVGLKPWRRETVISSSG